MIELRILGPPNLRRTTTEGDGPMHLQPKRLALLAYLALASADGYCRRDHLLPLFWPDLDEAHARNALSQAVYRLRRVLGREAVANRGAEELRVTPERVWCDALAFEHALADDRPDDALALYRGPLLDGLYVSDAPAFERWRESERERLRLRAGTAAGALAEREEAAGNPAGAVRWLRQVLDLAPDDESALRRLMRLLDRLGDRPGALRAYDAFTKRLSDDLDLSPTPATRSLAERLRTAPEAPSAPPSIAVLPFANLSADPEQAFFCDGMTEELINVLAQIPGLRVAARSSVFAFRDRPVDIRALAAQLHVDAVIEGSVRRAGDRVRVTAQLIAADSGYHLWSERYDRPLEDVFAVQDDIAHAIAETLRIELLPSSAKPPPAPTDDMEAHTLYLHGLYHRRKRTPEDIEKACAFFRQAAERDPEYARAHAALALTYALGGWFLFDVFAPRFAYPRAQAAAERALALDDRAVEAHLATALVRMAFDWDGPGAERAFERTLALDPDNVDTLGNYSGLLVLRGRHDEAITLTRRAQALDPFWIMPHTAPGIWLFSARRYEEAIAQLRQAHEMEPHFYVPLLFLGDAYRFTDRPDAARDAYRRVLDLVGRRPIVLGRLGALDAAQGRREAALETVEELREQAESRHVPPFLIAEIHVALGEHERALHWLNKALDARDPTLTLLGTWPAFDPLRSDPRFQEILAQIRITRPSVSSDARLSP